MEKEKLIRLYNKQARQYEKLRKKKKSFDQQWRKQLLASARGSILEVAVGAGANFKFYPATATVTAVDISPAMIEKAREAAQDAGFTAEFKVSDVESLNFPAQSFDTIVSTLSLCAYEDPVQVLNLFNHWCKEDGQMLLMEHGLANSQAIQWLQHRLDGLQCRFIGCHADRNILQLVGNSALQLKKYQRKMLGMIYLVWAGKGK